MQGAHHGAQKLMTAGRPPATRAISPSSRRASTVGTGRSVVIRGRVLSGHWPSDSASTARAPSRTRRSWSAGRSFQTSFLPDGHRTSSESTFSILPSPKWRSKGTCARNPSVILTKSRRVIPPARSSTVAPSAFACERTAVSRTREKCRGSDVFSNRRRP